MSALEICLIASPPSTAPLTERILLCPVRYAHTGAAPPNYTRYVQFRTGYRANYYDEPYSIKDRMNTASKNRVNP